MNEIKHISILMICILLMFSCDKEQEILATDPIQAEPEIQITLVNDKLKFDNKESLEFFVNESGHSRIKAKVEEFTENGFNSLRPILDDGDDDGINNFLM